MPVLPLCGGQIQSNGLSKPSPFVVGLRKNIPSTPYPHPSASPSRATSLRHASPRYRHPLGTFPFMRWRNRWQSWSRRRKPRLWRRQIWCAYIKVWVRQPLMAIRKRPVRHFWKATTRALHVQSCSSSWDPPQKQALSAGNEASKPMVFHPLQTLAGTGSAVSER